MRNFLYWSQQQAVVPRPLLPPSQSAQQHTTQEAESRMGGVLQNPCPVGSGCSKEGRRITKEEPPNVTALFYSSFRGKSSLIIFNEMALLDDIRMCAHPLFRVGFYAYSYLGEPG